jgi:hypothetical protein
MKIKCYFSIFIAILTMTGCTAGREKITFSSESLPAQPQADSIPSPPKIKGLEKEELEKIEVVVFSYLLQKHFGDDEFSAIFLETTDAETSVLAKKFPKHIPPIKTLWHAQIRPNRSPLDRDTSRPAIIFNVNALESENGTVEAIGRWFAGDARAGFYIFELRKSGDDWLIKSMK